MKNKIQKIINKNKIEGLFSKGSTEYVDYQNRSIVTLSYELERAGVIDFSFEERESDSDAWVEVTYYSNKIQKTIIMDHDARTGFEDIDDLTQYIEDIQKEINTLEDSITIIK